MKKDNNIAIVSFIFCFCLVFSNIASNKIIDLFGLNIDAGFIFFPITYIINDILTEVYGFNASRRLIWLGFVVNALTVLSIWLVVMLPPSNYWHNQQAFEQTFNISSRIFLASSIAYLLGEFLNSFILAKLKVKTKGNFMPLRFIISTIFGAALENTAFYLIAFLFIMPISLIFEMMLVQYTLKIVLEIIVLPVTCYIASYLKIKNNIDYYDTKTTFNPLKLL